MSKRTGSRRPHSTVDLRDLVGACAAGKRHALGEFYDVTASKALALAHAVTQDRVVAEDVVAQAYVEMWAEAPAYVESRPVSSHDTHIRSVAGADTGRESTESPQAWFFSIVYSIAREAA